MRWMCPVGRVVTLVVALAVLTSCGASNGSTTRQSSGRSSTASSAATRTTAHDLTVYLCAGTSPAPCRGQATSAQTAAIRRLLLADHDIAGVGYRSQAQEYREVKRRLPEKATTLVRADDIPAVFVVKTAPTARDAVVAARYRHLPGVLLVKA